MSFSYRDILNRADQHFASIASSQPANLECRRGCTLCCHGLFEIGAADVAIVVAGMETLPADVRDDITRKAAAIHEEFDHPVLSEATAEEKNAFFARSGEVACPALGDDGGCRIYEHRPLVCRTFGLTIRQGAEYLGEECELNFTEATPEQRESAAWDLEWEDEVGPEDQFTIPQAILFSAKRRS